MSKTYQPLDELLDETGLKKKVIAERMGVDYSVFYKWRKNPKSISAIELGELSEATGISFTVLYDTVKKFKVEHDKLASG